MQGRHFFTGCVKAEIKAYYRIPKSDSKNKRQLKLDGKIRPNKKPDVDNIIKAVLDALNGVAYTDDAAIVEANIKNKRQLKLDGKIRPNKKPDVDNIIKAVLDALNGVAYTDDAAIVEANIKKFYSNDPRIELTLEDVEGE